MIHHGKVTACSFRSGGTLETTKNRIAPITELDCTVVTDHGASFRITDPSVLGNNVRPRTGLPVSLTVGEAGRVTAVNRRVA